MGLLRATILAMRELLDQIRRASAAGLYYLALIGALALPDICGALSSDDGWATPSTYKDWLRNNVPEQAANAAATYGLRCSLLHQGRARPHGVSFPIACCYPSPSGFEIHNLSTVVGGSEVGWLSIPTFVDEVTRGAERWFDQFGETKAVARNLEKFMHFRPDGLRGHYDGPVIA
jgi:hypothetical protein